jgi:uncharacterized protein YyaL (SSP411 family)
MKLPALFLCVCLFSTALPAQAKPADDIAWQAWSPQVFEQAKAQHKFVFLYLEAVWCHWCHVMQQDTFTDVAVKRALAKNYIAVRADHDADPLLASRYRDYGWPALIYFAPDGTELVKRAGYIAPEDFTRLLAAIVKDPKPEASAPVVNIAGSSRLPAAIRQNLLRVHEDSYDPKLGGLKGSMKFLDRDSVEYSLTHTAEANKATQTLSAATALLDPVWGGVYQYSTGGDWSSPHTEKIMRSQAGYLRIYALAYARFGREQDLKTAQAIRDYLKNFLRSPDGAFYVSQDADLIQGEKAHDYFLLNDAERRKRGMPRIDQHRYADANGQAAEALTILYEVSGDESALKLAQDAVRWTLSNRSLKGGGFRHDQVDRSGPYLSDSVAMGRAFLALYRATAQREWLTHALQAAQFIHKNFRARDAGFLSARAAVGPVKPLPDVQENIITARFFNLLSHYQGDAKLKAQAEHAMKFLSAYAQDLNVEEAGILIADEELSSDPAHFTIVGSKQDAAARALFDAARKTSGSYKRVEWWDRDEGPLPNTDVGYPKLEKAAGYICVAGRCSLPSFTSESYQKQIIKLVGQ